MNRLNGRAIVFAGAIGVGLQLLYSVGTFFLLRDTLNNFLSDPSALTEESLSQMARFQAFTLLACGLSLIFLLGTGVLYAYFHQRETPLTLESAALGGAVTGGITYIISSLASTTLQMQRVTSVFETVGADLPPDAEPFFSTALTISIICGVIIGIVIGSIGGAAGGAIGASIWKER